MGKFSPTRYDPRDDSSPSTEAYRPGYRNDPTGWEGVILDRTLVNDQRACPCGCRKVVAGRARFRMGHDMRLKGILIRAHLTNNPVHVIEADGRMVTRDADAEAATWTTEVYDWQQMLRDAEAKQGDSVRAKLERANREVLGRALGLHPGSRVLVKVGRWEYTGQVVAIYDVGDGEAELEYVTKSGETKTVRKPLAEVGV